MYKINVFKFGICDSLCVGAVSFQDTVIINHNHISPVGILVAKEHFIDSSFKLSQPLD